MQCVEGVMYFNCQTHGFIFWCYSGPEGVKIDNADTAVAVVTGLQEGEYIFTLTVTDERMLENSDTVSVIVREGVCP